MFDSDKDKEIKALRAEVDQLKKDVARLFELVEKLIAIVKP